MICIISSAKTFEKGIDIPTVAMTTPFALDKTEQILTKVQALNVEELGKLLKVSDNLAHENYMRYRTWSQEKGIPALHGYNGDVFRALKSEGLTKENWEHANSHLAIFSGLYGILRPTDEIKPYRLEMATKMENLLGESIYDFWRGDVTEQLNVIAKEAGAKYILNLASQEYSAVLDKNKLTVPIINVVFKNQTPNGLRTIAIYAKRARGRMARFVLDNNIQSPEEIMKFSDGYLFRLDLSTDEEMVFVA